LIFSDLNSIKCKITRRSVADKIEYRQQVVQQCCIIFIVNASDASPL
jgi:hypothetical protein